MPITRAAFRGGEQRSDGAGVTNPNGDPSTGLPGNTNLFRPPGDDGDPVGESDDSDVKVASPGLFVTRGGPSNLFGGTDSALGRTGGG
jgi:hypothetical protein